MKEFIEKLKARLEKCSFSIDDSSHTIDIDVVDYNDAIEIVNELAEEYKPCNKLSCKDCEVYDKEKHYCPKWCDVIKHTAEELTKEHIN